jgi:DNA (cytosine-5)-methyltransferase 1
MTAYYNENDPKAAAWLRELIKRGHLAPGEVDERSIEDVRPDELFEFTQCHFFAGIGVWGYSLRKAGWPDDRPVWTGSCPCQPFSAAGKGTGFADERHLWPAWHHLISQCRPPVIFGEQVASKDGLAWLDLVHADMEKEGYAVGAFDLCAAGVGAPHIRQRLYFVAHTSDSRRKLEPYKRSANVFGKMVATSERGQKSSYYGASDGKLANLSIIGRDGRRSSEAGDEPGQVERPDGLCNAGGMADADGWNAGAERQQHGGQQRQQPQDGGSRGMADATSGGCGKLGDAPQQGRSGHVDGGGATGGLGHAEIDGNRACDWEREKSARPQIPLGGPSISGDRPGPTNGHWRDADWLGCTDGKWRPVEPGTFPLAHGSPARVGRLRGYGNAIVAPLAQIFIEEAMRCIDA